MRRVTLLMGLALLAFAFGCARTKQLVLVEEGVSRAPIIVPERATEATTQAANELADYIEKISGARPDVVAGVPDPIPSHAVWVGFQPRLAKLLPGLRLNFVEVPEETLIACDGSHLVIAGRDRSVGETQVEFGTANAVYTFLQKYLDVRWLWPGPLGEDIVKRDTIALSPFVTRYAPQFRQRDIIMFWVWRWFEYDPERREQLISWVRRQRLLFDSFEVDAGHAFSDWWDDYHEEHPDYFALQPDGTRSGYPGSYLAKLCQSNPKVWEQWLDNVEETLKAEPSQETFNGSPNDWFNSGICVCEKCRALDNPDAPAHTYDYGEGKTEEYVTMSQRYSIFWNRLARGLKERFPDRRLYVAGSAYGPAMEPPRKVELADNVVISYVGHFPLTTEASRQEQKAQWQRWAEKAPVMIYRPNLWYFGGGGWGFPEVAMRKTIEDWRFLAENRCAGVVIDMNRSYWATHGPQYYLMAQLTWDPHQDGQAVLRDYYRRGFGPAAEAVEKYWTLMEQARDELTASSDFATGHAKRFNLPAVFEQVYSNDLLNEADELLKQAAARTAGAPEIYAKRVAFVRTGFDVMALLARNLPLMDRVRESEGKDAEAVKQVIANWDEIQRICREASPHSIRHDHFGIHFWLIENGYMGEMQDYFGPTSEEYCKAAGLE